MTTRLEQILETVFRLEEHQGEDKVTSLSDAIRHNIKPGMTLHFGEAANALASEVVRQFWGEKPQFTLVISMLGEQMAVLIHAGLAKKLITAVCADYYPGPSPSYIIQRAYKEGGLEIENWSLLSLVQRFMAGALDLEFMPTNSIIGSGAADENNDAFIVIDDPFGSEKKLGAVKSLNPDVSLIHGWVSDRQGNTIIAPSRFSGQGAWGAKAAKNVVVSVERIVSTDFIRAYSSLVDIPGFMVSAVCLTPLGAHPQALLNCGIPELGTYGDDYDFLLQQKMASQDRDKFDTWVREWILGCPTHEDYLAKLGYERVGFLRSKAMKDMWKYDLASLMPSISTSPEYNPVEMMIVAGARKVTEKILSNRYKVLVGGFGASSLVAWLAYYQTKEKGYDVGLTTASGCFGHAPRPGDPLLVSASSMATCRMLTSVVDTAGIFASGTYSSNCISVFGTGQVDKYGNLNSTVSQGVFITGAGGGNDSANVQEAVAFLKHRRDRFVPSVPFITIPGQRIKTVISTLGVFEKLDGEELILTGYFPDTKHTSPVDFIRENCGWDLKVRPKVKEIPAPSLDELLTLRLLDPSALCTST